MPDPSAVLDLQSQEQGLLLPRMSTAERDAINSPAPGLMIYNTDDSCFNYYSGASWIQDCGAFLQQEVPKMQQVHGNSNKEAVDVCSDSVGNKYVTGYFNGTAYFGEDTLVGSTSPRFFLAKYLPDNQLAWVKTFPVSVSHTGRGVAVDGEGNPWITGHFTGELYLGGDTINSNGSIETFVMKFDPSGNLIWVLQSGSTGSDEGSDIGIDAYGNAYVFGKFEDSISFHLGTQHLSVGGFDIYVVKIDRDGNPVWLRTFGGTQSEFTSEIAVDPWGNSTFIGNYTYNFTIGSETFQALGSGDIYVARLDSSGTLLWAKSCGGPASEDGSGIAVDHAGNSYATGGFSSMAIFDNDTIYSTGFFDTFLTKYDPSGHVLWVRSGGGIDLDFASSVYVNAEGSIWVTGNFFRDASFSGQALVSTSLSDIFVLHYDASGHLNWAEQAGGFNNDLATAVTVDVLGNCHVVGFFQSEFISGEDTLISTGGNDMYLLSLDAATGGTASPYSNTLAHSEDQDSDPLNEIQSLELNGQILSISNGNQVDLALLARDEQGLTFSDSILSISGGNQVTLNGIDTDLDHQTLSLSGSMLSISGGNQVDLNGLNTDDQTLGFDPFTSILSIENGNQVDLTPLGDNLGNHILTQNIRMQGNWVSNDGTNSGLYIDQKGRLGLGISPLEAGLHISSPTDGLSSGIKLSNSGYNSGIYLENGDLVLRKLNQTDQLVLDRSGKVGIGTSTPTHQLTIQGTGGSASNLFLIEEALNFSLVQYDPVMQVIDENNNEYFSVQNDGSNAANRGHTIIYGQLQVKSGDPNAGEILTTDDDGNASWTRLPETSFTKTASTNTYLSSLSWRTLTDWTDYIPSFSNAEYQLNASFTTRLTGGSGNDDYQIKVACECSDGNLDSSRVHIYRPAEVSSDHNNFKEVHYLDIIDNPCSIPSNIRFRLIARNIGNDDWEARNRVLVIREL